MVRAETNISPLSYSLRLLLSAVSPGCFQELLILPDISAGI